MQPSGRLSSAAAAAVDVRDGRGRTPLLVACETPGVPAAVLVQLLAHGADPQAADHSGAAPLAVVQAQVAAGATGVDGPGRVPVGVSLGEASLAPSESRHRYKLEAFERCCPHLFGGGSTSNRGVRGECDKAAAAASAAIGSSIGGGPGDTEGASEAARASPALALVSASDSDSDPSSDSDGLASEGQDGAAAVESEVAAAAEAAERADRERRTLASEAEARRGLRVAHAEAPQGVRGSREAVALVRHALAWRWGHTLRRVVNNSFGATLVAVHRVLEDVAREARECEVALGVLAGEPEGTDSHSGQTRSHDSGATAADVTVAGNAGDDAAAAAAAAAVLWSAFPPTVLDADVRSQPSGHGTSPSAGAAVAHDGTPGSVAVHGGGTYRYLGEERGASALHVASALAGPDVVAALLEALRRGAGAGSKKSQAVQRPSESRPSDDMNETRTDATAAGAPGATGEGRAAARGLMPPTPGVDTRCLTPSVAHKRTPLQYALGHPRQRHTWLLRDPAAGVVRLLIRHGADGGAEACPPDSEDVARHSSGAARRLLAEAQAVPGGAPM